MTKTTERRVGAHDIEVAKPDKLLFPDDGITKERLVGYYADIAPAMVPHLEGRPLTMQRFPDGIDDSGFYEKKAPEHFPDWVGRVRVDTKDGPQEQIVCDDPESLAYLADQACVTPHAWLSRRDDLDHPDQMIFDLDPSADDVELVRHAAHSTGELLADLGLTSYVKTTGSKGFHVHVPLDRSAGFEAVRGLARDVARLLADGDPDRLTVEQRKDKRGYRVYVDVLRNAYGQTAVSPYAVRARPGAPVATPLDWSEVRSVTPDRYTVSSVRRRLAQRDDPWTDMERRGQSLAAPREKLRSLLEAE